MGGVAQAPIKFANKKLRIFYLSIEEKGFIFYEIKLYCMFIPVKEEMRPVDVLKKVKIASPHIVVSPEKCSLCKVCEAVCAEAKEGISDLKRARIRIASETGQPEAKACQNCEYPACVRVCPTGALKASRWEITTIDEGNCTGCGLCAEECPHNAIYMVNLNDSKNSRKKVARLCDLCGTCVSNCPFGALSIEGVSIRK